jgi:hypothetical protein
MRGELPKFNMLYLLTTLFIGRLDLLFNARSMRDMYINIMDLLLRFSNMIVHADEKTVFR